MYASEASAAGRWRVCMYLGRRRVIIIPTTPDTRIQEVASQTRDVKDRDLQKRYNHTRKDSISERKCQKCRCIFASYCRRCSAHSRRTQRTRAAPAAPRLVSGPRPRPPGERNRTAGEQFLPHAAPLNLNIICHVWAFAHVAVENCCSMGCKAARPAGCDYSAPRAREWTADGTHSVRSC